METAGFPEKPATDNIVSKIHENLQQLSSFPHQLPSSQVNRAAPPPNLHVGIFGQLKYTRPRRVRLPDGRIVDEGYKHPRPVQHWSPPPPRRRAPRAPQAPDTSLQVRSSSPQAPEQPDHAHTNPSETNKSDKRRIKIGAVVFPLGAKMPGYVPPHLRGKLRDPSPPSLADRHSSPGLESSKWAPLTPKYRRQVTSLTFGELTSGDTDTRKPEWNWSSPAAYSPKSPSPVPEPITPEIADKASASAPIQETRCGPPFPREDEDPVSVMVFKPVFVEYQHSQTRDKSLSSVEEPKEDEHLQMPETEKPSGKRSKWPKITKGQLPSGWNDWDPKGGWDEPPSRNDPNDVSHLLDWKGDWLPAPPDWESRSKYTDGDEIKKWALWVENTEYSLRTEHNIVTEYEGPNITLQKKAIRIRHKAFTEGTHEIVPRYWLPEKIEGQSMQTFWKSFVHSSSPPPFEETEEPPSTPEWVPFWNRYNIDGLPYAEPLQPPHYQMDKTDEYYEVYETDRGSDVKAKNWRPMFNSEGGKHAKKKNRGKKPAKPDFYDQLSPFEAHIPAPRAFEPVTIPVRPQPYTLKANIYLRNARAGADDRQIADIYNHYVLNSVQAAEMQPRSVADIADRTEAARRNGYTCIVAVERGDQKLQGRRCGLPSLLSIEEKVVGYAMADDFLCNTTMYKYSAEMEMHIHPDYLRQGIGSVLLDRMIFLLDPEHRIRIRGAEWREKDVSFVNPGAMRWTQNISCSVPYKLGAGGDRVKWMATWLKSFGFEKVGEWDKVGVKLGSWVSLALFQKRTGAEIDPKTAV